MGWLEDWGRLGGEHCTDARCGNFRHLPEVNPHGGMPDHLEHWCVPGKDIETVALLEVSFSGHHL
jgi:hypothetical protein